jgi:hypothetical protein
MNKQAALNSAGNAVSKFLEHQTVPVQGAQTPAELGKKYAEFIAGLHAGLVAYFEKVGD